MPSWYIKDLIFLKPRNSIGNRQYAAIQLKKSIISTNINVKKEWRIAEITYVKYVNGTSCIAQTRRKNVIKKKLIKNSDNKKNPFNNSIEDAHGRSFLNQTLLVLRCG